MLTNTYVRANTITLTDKPLDSFLTEHPPPYIVEPKFDGERILCLKSRNEISLANRHSTVYDNLPAAFKMSIRKAVKAKQALIDGEFIAIGGDLYSFLSARAGFEGRWKPGIVFFDLLQLNNSPLKNYPLNERLSLLKRTVNPSEDIFLPEGKICSTAGCIKEVFNETIKRGFEGVIVKPLNSPYIDKVWCKVKRIRSIDAVIMAAAKTPSSRRGGPFNSYLIGLYGDEGLKPVSKVSSGLERKVKEIITKLVPILKTYEDRDYIYIEPKIVVEVQYHSRVKNGLRESRLLKVRFDKPPEECSIKQLNT